MVSQLFPHRFDNTYRGHKVAVWLFAVAVFVKAVIGLNSIFNGYTVARSADGIPLETFTPAGAQAVVYLLAILGLAHLMICLLCILVFVRYRSMIPLMLALLLIEYLSRRVILHFLPVPRVGAPPGPFVNLLLLALMAVGLAFSLSRRNSHRIQE